MSESKFLGKQVEYPHHYSPEMLVSVPRELNREEYDISDDNLPFYGVDVWHAYELSFMTKKGLPVSGLLKIVYPCDNPAIVESKSLKLYLNSFNMEPYGDTPDEGIRQIDNRATSVSHFSKLMHYAGIYAVALMFLLIGILTSFFTLVI